MPTKRVPGNGGAFFMLKREEIVEVSDTTAAGKRFGAGTKKEGGQKNPASVSIHVMLRSYESKIPRKS